MGGEGTHEANPFFFNEFGIVVENNTVLVPVCVYGFGGEVFTSSVREVTRDICSVILRTDWDHGCEKKGVCTYVLRE